MKHWEHRQFSKMFRIREEAQFLLYLEKFFKESSTFAGFLISKSIHSTFYQFVYPIIHLLCSPILVQTFYVPICLCVLCVTPKIVKYKFDFMKTNFKIM